jgi:hypothetical protein
MFSVIYQGFVKPGLEEQYRVYWKAVASYFVNSRGALGSSLHRTENGMWVAYSKWPDKATRDASWSSDKNTISSDIPIEVQKAIIGLKDCLDGDRQFPEICMEVVEEMINPLDNYK